MATLFVFYELTESGGSWTYDKMPKSWHWVGKGSTSPIASNGVMAWLFTPKTPEYPSEEQFSGDKATQKKMRGYLDAYFKKLKTKGVVTKYKTRTTYSP
jgi:hypothetical protein